MPRLPQQGIVMIPPIYDQPACTHCAHCGKPITLTWTTSCEHHQIYHGTCYKKAHS